MFSGAVALAEPLAAWKVALLTDASEVRSNALEPGWVPTKMGGPGAPDDLSLAPVTQAWLAAGEDPRTDVTGEYFYHQQVRRSHPAAHDPRLQDALLDYCAALTTTPLPDL